MSNDVVVAFLPCRSGSERVANKNTKPFAEIEGGLLKIKLQQLLCAERVSRIVLSTDDDEVKKIGRSLRSPNIVIDDRPKHLALSSTSTDELIQYVPTIIEDAHILWTHVTSPFSDENLYDDAIKTYFEQLKNGFDSLMSVTEMHKFMWFREAPVNYDRNVEKWPRTQTLEPVLEVNSAIFLTHSNIYRALSDRIGAKPYLFKMDGKHSFDIDWEIDFKVAELMWKHERA